MENLRLFRLAVESGSVSFNHYGRDGWSLTVALRRGDEAWTDVVSEHYSGLTTVELLDTLAAHLDSHL